MRSRRNSAIAVPIAAEIPAIESANPNGGDVGGVSGQPLMYANPLPVSATVPKPGFPVFGPYCPNPLTLVITSPGWSAESAS